jgi:hypothetical protein
MVESLNANNAHENTLLGEPDTRQPSYVLRNIDVPMARCCIYIYQYDSLLDLDGQHVHTSMRRTVHHNHWHRFMSIVQHKRYETLCIYEGKIRQWLLRFW